MPPVVPKLFHRLTINHHRAQLIDGQRLNVATEKKNPTSAPLTVDGQSDGQAGHAAHGVLHCAGVDVVVRHQHPRDGQQLLVGRQQEPRHVGQRFAAFEPPVRRPGSVFMGAVEDDVLAELQHRGGLHVNVGPRYTL